MDKSAFLVIDVQNDYCEPEGVFSKANFDISSIPSIYQNINRLADWQRKRNAPVIWVKMVWDNDEEVGRLSEISKFLKYKGMRRGTWGAEIVSELDVHEHDIIVEKKRFSAFYDTELDNILKKLGVTELFMAGVRTDFCVESSVRDAFFRDYKVVIVDDCVAGFFQELHENSLKVMGTVFADIKSTEDIIKSNEEVLKK